MFLLFRNLACFILNCGQVSRELSRAFLSGSNRFFKTFQWLTRALKLFYAVEPQDTQDQSILGGKAQYQFPVWICRG